MKVGGAFLSHSRHDKGQHREQITRAAINSYWLSSLLASTLERRRLPHYVDFKSLNRMGGTWETELLSEARNSKVFVVILSPTYPMRYWCMVELFHAWNRAREGQLDIVCVFYGLKEASFESMMPRWRREWKGMCANSRMHVDIKGWEESLLYLHDQRCRKHSLAGEEAPSSGSCVMNHIQRLVASVGDCLESMLPKVPRAVWEERERQQEQQRVSRVSIAAMKVALSILHPLDWCNVRGVSKAYHSLCTEEALDRAGREKQENGLQQGVLTAPERAVSC